MGLWNMKLQPRRIGAMNPIRGILRQITAAALALAFTATAIPALGGHACPHHDGLPAANTAEFQAGAGHDGHGDAGIDRHHESDTPAHDGPCTCVGTCATQAPVALPAAPVVHAIGGLSPTITAGIESSTTVVLAAPPYLLPFATPPPTR